MTGLIRAFIAIELPETLKQTIDRTQRGMTSLGLKMSWVKPEAVHVTLKFMGDILQSEIEPIYQAMVESTAEISPITCSIKGVGIFPNIRKPRVFWIGLDDKTQALTQLSRKLNDTIQTITDNRIPAEHRPFKAHLTIGRIRSEPDTTRLIAGLKQFGMLTSEPFTATEIHLFQSQLFSSGAIHTWLKTAQMMGRNLMIHPEPLTINTEDNS